MGGYTFLMYSPHVLVLIFSLFTLSFSLLLPLSPPPSLSPSPQSFFKYFIYLFIIFFFLYFRVRKGCGLVWFCNTSTRVPPTELEATLNGSLLHCC